MASKSAAEETSERKRVSIPKADESVLQWWNLQHDPALSIRTLIRAEIERAGYVDAVFKPVVQLPRRGRPPGSTAIEGVEEDETPRAPVTAITTAPDASKPTPEPVTPTAGPSAIDALMNG